MINAAEPIDFNSIHQFVSLFREYGLNPEVIKPTYGLAEHTVFVCSGGTHVLRISKRLLEEQGVVEVLYETSISSIANEDPINLTEKDKLTSEDSQIIIGCGYPNAIDYGISVVIVDPSTNIVLPDLRVGEIWINSPSKALGYWNLPELSSHEFFATIATLDGEYSELPVESSVKNENLPAHDASLDKKDLAFLRSGDLGFLYHNELFICGRQKDMIIIRGSNHYPQDIERTAEMCTDKLRLGCSAAFAVKLRHHNTEGVVYIAEVLTAYTVHDSLV